MKDCTTCQFHQTFKPRPDEKSGHGCKARGEEGYILDPTKPPCSYGGNRPLAYATKAQ